jgi:hypothetical protein
MFSQKITDSDAFIEMPSTAQNFYFHLCMRADDDGFINNPRRIQRTVRASDDDFKILLAKRFLISFESGVVVIKHWRIHNYISKDRYKETLHAEEKAQLLIKDNGSYTECTQPVYKLDTQVRLGKDSIGEVRIEEEAPAPRPPRVTFKKPTLGEVSEYCQERKNGIDAEAFIAYYESNGWMVGRVHMKNWKSAIVTWERNNGKRKGVEYGDVAKYKQNPGGMPDHPFTPTFTKH